MNILAHLAVSGSFEGVVLYLLIFVQVSLWVWAIFHLIKNASLDNMNKVVWVIVIMCFPLLGPIIYLLFGKNQKANA
jgi:hypothetical protein